MLVDAGNLGKRGSLNPGVKFRLKKFITNRRSECSRAT